MGRVNSTYIRQLVHQRDSWVDDTGDEVLAVQEWGGGLSSDLQHPHNCQESW